MSLRRLAFCGLFLWLSIFATVGSAHRLPPEVVAFFKVDGARLRVLVRVPTAMLGDAKLPLVEGAYLDLRRLDDPLRAVAAEVVRSLEVADGGRPLTPGSPAWRLAGSADGTFSSADAAAAGVARPPVPPDRYVYFTDAFADFSFDYPLGTGPHALSARLNGLRAGGEFFQTRATFVPASGRPRTLLVAGAPQRVAFEPPLGTGVGAFLRGVVDGRLVGGSVLLFLLCLAASARSHAAPRRPLSALVGGYAGTAVLVVAAGMRPSPSVLSLAALVAGGALTLAAAQAFLGSRAAGASIAAATFGVASGLGFGTALLDVVPLAGAYAPAGVLTLVGLLLAGAFWAAALLHSIVRALLRSRVAEWLVLACLAAPSAHAGAHAVMDAAAQLAGVDESGAVSVLDPIVAHWPVIALAAALVLTSAVALSSTPLPRQPQDGRASS